MRFVLDEARWDEGPVLEIVPHSLKGTQPSRWCWVLSEDGQPDQSGCLSPLNTEVGALIAGLTHAGVIFPLDDEATPDREAT